jgi:hypothetical protein
MIILSIENFLEYGSWPIWNLLGSGTWLISPLRNYIEVFLDIVILVVMGGILRFSRLKMSWAKLVGILVLGEIVLCIAWFIFLYSQAAL